MTQTGGTKVDRDQEYIHNEDFVFFRLSMGSSPASSRFGSSCFVFDPQDLFRVGWVSLHDMLNPMASDSMNSVTPQASLQERKKNPFAKPWRTSKSDGEMITHTYASGGSETIHKLGEVFFGPDILPGLALWTIREERLIGAGLPLLVRESFGNPLCLFNLVAMLFRPEAKIPKVFRFQRAQPIKLHRDAPYMSTI